MTDDLLVDVADRVATLTLNRPAKRNALSSHLIGRLGEAMAEADADAAVDVIILTGSDPAFCAGLDLGELGDTADNLGERPDPTVGYVTPWAPTAKPVIGAINGACITGGFEIALHCDVRIASERAVFADTHTRVGVVPAWGMSVLLPAAVGFQRARYLSLTGEFVTAEAAELAGLVLETVPHAELLDRCVAVAREIAARDQAVVRSVLATHRAVALGTQAAGLRLEAAASWEFRTRFDPAMVAARRNDVIGRGRAHQQATAAP